MKSKPIFNINKFKLRNTYYEYGEVCQVITETYVTSVHLTIIRTTGRRPPSRHVVQSKVVKRTGTGSATNILI